MVSLPAEASCEGWVVAHQHPCMHPPAGALAGVGQGPKKEQVIFLIVKNRLPQVSPRHDVIKRTGRLDSKTPSHTEFSVGDEVLSSCCTLTPVPVCEIHARQLSHSVPTEGGRPPIPHGRSTHLIVAFCCPAKPWQFAQV